MSEDGIKHYKTVIRGLEKDFDTIRERLLPLSGAIKHTQKLSAFDVLTELDDEVEKLLAKRLNELDPGTPIVGEEQGGDRTARRYWLIDPIDGTIHFTRGNDFCTIMMALIEDLKPVVGIIYNLANKDLYYAIKGVGAYKNGQRLKTSTRTHREAMVLTEIRLGSQHNLAIYQELSKRFKLMNLCCAGYEFIMVADGRAEARVCLDPFGNDYDFAAGSLIVQEAGGIVQDLEGNDYKTTHSDMIIAASQPVYQEIQSIITAIR